MSSYLKIKRYWGSVAPPLFFIDKEAAKRKVNIVNYKQYKLSEVGKEQTKERL